MNCPNCNASIHDLAVLVALRAELDAHARFEQELQTANTELKRSNADLEQFAYAASHDLQEPLRTIASYAGLLAKRCVGRLGEAADEYLTIIQNAAKRMQAMIEALLAYARAGSNNTPLVPVHVGAALEDALAALNAAVVETGATIQVTTTLPTVLGDRQQLALLFQNLLANAIKFRSAAAPEVRVSVTAEGPWWHFEVADNGIGVDPAYCDKLFTLFARLHTRDRYPGTGLGLALCRRIVERHGGVIALTGIPGRGVVVRFNLPVLAGEQGS